MTRERRTLPIIPVLDVMDGRVVRAVGGRRAEYQPIRSLLTNSCEPLDVARAMITATNADTLYVADLDGIVTGTPSAGLLERLDELPVRILLDCGIRTGKEAMASTNALSLAIRAQKEGRSTAIVVGTETAEGTVVFERLRQQGIADAILSVDLMHQQLLGNWRAWGAKSADAVADVLARAIEECGLREVILLDLGRVGGGAGAGTERIISAASCRYPDVRFYAGGGVSIGDAYRSLADAGAAGVLVASAIHDGTFHEFTDR